jgi:hypothetical protein
VPGLGTTETSGDAEGHWLREESQPQQEKFRIKQKVEKTKWQI